jgi:hypothetical protein
MQLYLRRQLVQKQKEKHQEVWPVLESSKLKPEKWQGWPEGKKFSFVLTHDVEHRAGHDKCIELMNIEKKLGFVSSFNFVPERYKVDKGLRESLAKNGFEVGVHGLIHDGKLFRNKRIFDERASKINNYLKEWNAVGFRAPAMHHNLDWICELNIQYDLSTFDTDPFEPQSDGVGTIFPFWYESKNGKRTGYVEMPYTLVQDFTLLVLMKEKDCSIWKRKLDWIVENNGMALLNVHPDYVAFNDSDRDYQKFSVDIYIDFLKYVKNEYAGEYWNPLPKDLARFAKEVFVS